MWILLVFLFASIAEGATPCPTCPTKMVLDDVSSGLQTTKPPYKIGGTPRSRNVFIDDNRVKMISGFSIVGSTRVLLRGDGIFPYVTEDGKTTYLVTDSSIVLETADYNTYVFVSSGQTTSVLTRCKQIREKMWCYNGIDPVFTWDRTTKQVLNGTNGTPNVPRFKYAEYYQNRVFGLNNTLGNGASVLDWDDAVSTAGLAIAPDNFLAWPSGNELFVGKGDGEVATGLWVKDARLYVGKQHSRYFISGENTSSYKDNKIDAQSGPTSHDSIVTLDGHIYYVGLDGIYEDGVRISDEITAEVSGIINDTIRTIGTTWDTRSDFNKGDYSAGSTATVSGFLTAVYKDTFTIINNLDASATPNVITFTQSPYQTYITTFTNVVAPHNLKATVGGGAGSEVVYDTILNSNWILLAKRGDGQGSNCSVPTGGGFGMRVTNLRSGQSISRVVNEDAGYDSSFTKHNVSMSISEPSITFDGDDITKSSFSVSLEIRPQDGCTIEVKFPTVAARIILTLATTVQYVSDVTTITSVTSWGNFESINNTNGGQITYYTRTATSSVNIATQVWNPQTPGTQINAPAINNFVQWASTIASVSTDPVSVANIDNVVITHIEGQGSLERPFATSWNNRLWLAVATTTTGGFSKLYVKSKITNPNPSAWMPVEGINIRSFGKDGSNALYAGSASTGVFYRLDYGTNFNGQPIMPCYETPDIYLGDIYDEKSISEYMVFGENQSGNTLTLGTSINGSAFTDQSVSLDGTGRAIRLIQNVSGKGHYFRWRFCQNTLDKDLNITNFGVTYSPTRTRLPK